MIQKICISLNESNSRIRFILISSDIHTLDNLKKLYNEAKIDFDDLEENDIRIGISKENVYKDFLYIFFDIAMPNKCVLKKYFKVNNFS